MPAGAPITQTDAEVAVYILSRVAGEGADRFDKAGDYYLTDEEKKQLTKRLNIIEGQIRGIKQMIEDDRYCADILMQLSAIGKSLEGVEMQIMESHISNCVASEIKAGNSEIVKEVMELFRRLR